MKILIKMVMSMRVMKHHIEDTNKVELMVMGPGAGAGAGSRKSMWGWRGHGPRNSQDLY